MKITFTLFALFILLAVSNSKSFAQFDKPSFQVNVGISEPMDDLKGPDYFTYTNFYNGTNYSYQLLLVDSSLIKDHYGAKTGFNFNGSAKINFDKYSIVRGVGFVSFNSFNSFQSQASGTTLVRFFNGTYQPISVKYNYGITTFSIGLGLEIAPTSFTNVISPFFGANVSANFINLNLERTFGGFADTNRVSASGTRFGVDFNGGIEYKVTPQWGIVLGARYDLANLLGKNTNQSLNDAIRFGSTNAGINDGKGTYYTNIYYAADEGMGTFQAREKKISWMTFYIGVNFYPSSLLGK